MKALIILILSITQANAIFLMSCSNYGSTSRPVSYSYEYCLNNNFSKIEREIDGLYLSNCSNYSRDKVDYSFTSCVNRNFRQIDMKLKSIFMMSCSNYNSSELSYSFTSCSNSNFYKVERKLNELFQ